MMNNPSLSVPSGGFFPPAGNASPPFQELPNRGTGLLFNWFFDVGGVCVCFRLVFVFRLIFYLP